MITINLFEGIMKISRFNNDDTYWFLVITFWIFYFGTKAHTFMHELVHVKKALQFGCSNHRVIIYDCYDNRNIIFLGIPVEFTTHKKGLLRGKASFTPRENLSDYEKYCITRAGFRYDFIICILFLVTTEIALFPAYYVGKVTAFVMLSSLIVLFSLGLLFAQYYIKGTDLYKMRCYKAKEQAARKRAIAKQNIENWRTARGYNSAIIDFDSVTVSNASK